MNCKKCGNVLLPTDTVCRVCGEPVTLSNVPNQPAGNIISPENVVANQVPNGVMPAAADALANNVSAPQTFVTPTEPVVPVNNVPPVPPVPPVAPPLDNTVQPQPVPPVAPVAPNIGVPPVAPQPGFAAPQPGVPTESTAQVPTEKKKTPVFMIIVTILVLVIVGLVVFISIKKFNENKSGGTSGDETANNGGGQVATVETFVAQNGVVYQLPTGYTNDTFSGSNGKLIDYIENSNGSFISGFNLYRDSLDFIYSDYNDHFDEWKTLYAEDGRVVQEISQQAVNGSSFVLVSIDDGGIQQYLAYSTIGAGKTVEVYIESLGGFTLENTLDILDNMYKNATRNGVSSFLAGEEENSDLEGEEISNASSMPSGKSASANE